MSKLELLIRQHRNVWEKLSVEPKMMDDMIDTFIKFDFDPTKVTDEDIEVTTRKYINNIMYEINFPKEKNAE